MAIGKTMVNIPLTNSQDESRINTPINQDPIDITKQKLSESTLDLTKFFQVDNQQNKETQKKENLLKTMIEWTTGSSALVNLISAPIRLFDDTNPLKKIINTVSMLFTKLHLAAYSLAGLSTAFRQKNPFLVFSFFTEGVAAFLGLDKIYLFRGIATGIDGAVGGIKDKNGKAEFSSFSEAYKVTMDTLKHSSHGLFSKLAKDPFHIFKLAGHDIAIFASLAAAAGGLVGMTIHEKFGSIVRDIFGAIGDYGIFSIDNPTAKKAGFAYLAGSIFDFTGRIFNKSFANLLGITHIESFERIKDAFLEVALACDRFGQKYYYHYTDKNDAEVFDEYSKSNLSSREKSDTNSRLHQYQLSA